MLKKWIDEIRNQPDLYKSECWKYHLSGNVVEISILPEYLKKKRLYRCSVINVGQVLQALSKKIEEKNLNFHIQSFPNLENPEFVATIRIDQKESFTNKNNLPQANYSNQNDAESILKKLTELYKFSLRKIDNPSNLEVEEKISFENYEHWFIIYSIHNNPFTWLNVGYLKESLRDQNLQSITDSLTIFDLCPLNIDQYTNLQMPQEYVQALVGIQPVNISAK